MSKVFSFRLDENNPREAQAIKIINAWVSKGYSLRYILVEALVDFDNEKTQEDDYTSALGNLINIVNELKITMSRKNNYLREKETLSSTFLESVSKNIQPGIRID